MTEHIDKQLLQKLSDFGLTEIESRIYLFLVNNTPRSFLEISKALNIPRTSIYDNSEKLLNKCLIEKILQSNTTLLKAFSLEILDHFIQREKDKIENMSSSLDFIKEKLIFDINISENTEVKYYSGVEGLRQMMWNALKAENEIVGYSIYGRREVVGDKFMSRYFEEFKKRGLRDRVIANPRKETMNYIRKYLDLKNHPQNSKDIRLLPSKKFYISGDTMIYNNTFAVCYWKHGKIVGVEMINPEFVKSQKSIFEILWSIAKRLK
ncbi:MAG: helix-turn-helix domain-containing protein [bacterium]